MKFTVFVCVSVDQFAYISAKPITFLFHTQFSLVQLTRLFVAACFSNIPFQTLCALVLHQFSFVPLFPCSTRYFLMDVTVHNFDRALNLLKRLLPGAAYVSIDFEFTGLGTTKFSNLDTPHLRYVASRLDAREFPPIQFGLTIFHRRQSPPYLFAIPFNFNIFPHAVYFPANQRYPLIDTTVKFQSSAIRFLTSHGFDFQTLFEYGVPWLRSTDERSFRQVVSDSVNARRNPKFPITPDSISAEHSDELKRFRTSINRWISSNPFTPSCGLSPKTTIFQIPHQPLLRRLIFDMIRQSFPLVSAKTIYTPEGARLRISVHPNKQLAKQQRLGDVDTEIDSIVNQEIGVRSVIDLLREQRVPIIVHHGLLDILKMYANFVSDLPPVLTDFKTAFQNAFPIVYDTRFAVDFVRNVNQQVAESLALDENHHPELTGLVTVLRRIVSTLIDDTEVANSICYPPVLVPTQNMRLRDPASSNVLADESGYVFVSEFDVDWDSSVDEYGFGRYTSSGSEFNHEAGFDALQTGRLFALIEALVGRGDCIQQLANKIFLSACGGYRYIDLKGHDPNDWFHGNVVIVRGKRSQGNSRDAWCTSSLRRLTQGTAFEGQMHNFVTINKTSFLGLLRKHESADNQVDSKELDLVIANSADLDLSVERYQESALDVDAAENAIKQKRRRLK